MSLFTYQLGALPVGLWIALVVLLVVGVLFGVGGQGLSLLSWKKAVALGLQEDDPDSEDPLQRALVPVEWGVAAADVIVQSVGILLALYGLLAGHWVGLLGGTIVFTIYIYAGLFFFLQRYGISFWGVGDWVHWRRIAIAFLLIAETSGLLGMIGLWANWRYFLL